MSGYAVRVFCTTSYLLIFAAMAAALESSGGGPLPVRNFQPIQQIFLNLPFERAATLPAGGWRLHLQSAQSNEIATAQGPVEAVLKFEQNRTVVGGAIGVLQGWEIGIDLPFMSRFGGFLDPVIDSVEDLFGADNVERKQFPNNSFGGFRVVRNGTLLFHGERQYLELGDLWLSTKYALWSTERTVLALRGAIKAPTGRSSSVWGSGKADFAAGVAIDHRPLSWLLLYGNLALTYPLGPITPGRLTLNPIVTEGIAGEALIGRGFSVVLQQGLYTSPIHGTGTRVLDGTVVELSTGINWRCGNLLLQLGGIQNVSGVAQAADFTLLAQIRWESGG